MIRLIVLSAFMAGMLGGASARADVDKEAKVSFEKGNRLFQDGNYDKALEAFERAYRLRPTWKLLFNIAQTQAAAKQYGLAIESFGAYLAEAGDEITVERQDEVRAEIARLRDMVGMVDVNTTKGATILIDGVKRGVAPVYGGIPVSAGKDHNVEVIIDGKTLPAITLKVLARLTVPVTISESGESVVSEATPSVQDEDATVAAVPATEDASDDGAPSEATTTESGSAPKAQKLQRLGIVLTAIGAAGLITGGITGGMALSKNSELDKKCVSASLCDDQYQSTEQSRNTLGTVSTVTFIAGGVSAVTGIVLMAVSKKMRTEQLTVVPVLGPQAAALQLGVAF